MAETSTSPQTMDISGTDQPDMPIECNLINAINSTLAQCKFLTVNVDCQDDASIVDYLNLFYCTIGSYESKIPSLAVGAIILVFLFLFMGVTADDFLCPNLVAVSSSLRMSQNIAGVTFLAFGNGAPDIFSSIAGIRQAKPDLVIGELLGAGIFVATVVCGSILLTGDFTIMSRPIVRDILFYGVSCFIMWTIIFHGKIFLWQTIFILSIYVVYIVVVIGGRIVYQRQQKKRNLEIQANHQGMANEPVSTIISYTRRKSSGQAIPRPTSKNFPTISVIGADGHLKVPSNDEMGRRSSGGFINPAFDVDNESIGPGPKSRSGSFVTPGNRQRSMSISSHRSHKIRNHGQNTLYAITHSSEMNPGEPCRDPFCRGSFLRSSNHSSRSGHSGHYHTYQSDEEYFHQSVHSNADILPSGHVKRSSIEANGPDADLDFDAEWTVYLDSLSPLRDFFYRLSPFGWDDLKKMSLMSKILTILKSPFILVISLTCPVVDHENHRHNWCRLLNSLHCLTGLLWMTYISGYFGYSIGGSFPLPILMAIIGAILGVTVFMTSSFDRPPVYHMFFSILGFVVAGSWTYLLASEVVSLLKAVGILINLSDVILGLTVLAWGNSLGDFVSNLSMARQGFPKMGISACFGGPLLNLLLGVGIPYTILLPELDGHFVNLDYSRMFTLLIATVEMALILTFGVFILTGFQSKKTHGIALIALYVGYLTIAICLEMNVI